MKQNIQLQQVQRNQIKRLISSRRTQTVDFTRGQKINVRDLLTGCQQSLQNREKNLCPTMSRYETKLYVEHTTTYENLIHSPYTIHPPKPDMHKYNHAPITPTIYVTIRTTPTTLHNTPTPRNPATIRTTPTSHNTPITPYNTPTTRNPAVSCTTPTPHNTPSTSLYLPHTSYRCRCNHTVWPNLTKAATPKPLTGLSTGRSSSW